MGADPAHSAQKRSATVLPQSAAAARNRLPPKGRSADRAFNNLKITILCGLVTILVLRGTIGLSNLASSDTDAERRFLIEETERIVAAIRSDDDLPDSDDYASRISPNSSSDPVLGPKITN